MKGEHYTEYKQQLNEMFQRYYQDICRTSQRHDIIDPNISYDRILEIFEKGTCVFEEFLQTSFDNFCYGYFHTKIDSVIQAGYPLAWGVNRYEFYEQEGRILKTQNCIQTDFSQYIYTTFDHQKMSKNDVLHQGYMLYQKIFDSAEHISEHIQQFFFSRNILRFEGIELTFRLVVSCPWDIKSSLVGEFYKYLYNYILVKFDTPISIRLIKR